MTAQIVTGLRFPGAGLIFVRRDPVRGHGRHASLAEHQMVDARPRRPGRLLDAGAPVQIPTGQPGTDPQRHDPAEQQAACRLLNAEDATEVIGAQRPRSIRADILKAKRLDRALWFHGSWLAGRFLEDGLAAGDGDPGTGDIAGLVGGKQHVGRRDFGGLSWAAEGGR